jgi:SAM-dependent methyltransferase
MTAAQIFDRIAPDYDRLWTGAPVGRAQREGFWRQAQPYLENSPRVLDVGCGTGEDALRLMATGADVTAIDISPRMVAIARSRGVSARVLAAERIGELEGPFDAVISNFGALNCVASLSDLGAPLARILNPGGHAILCLLSRFCLWETLWFFCKLDPAKAARRWSGENSAGGARVSYPSVSRVRRDLSPHFTLVGRFGIGIFVPPSYVPPVPRRCLDLARRADARVSALPGIRSMGDHTLLVFRRNPS